ncbi:hypothetical protein [Streptomyces cyaneus]|uniref:hypothetical protein n=1 Tax=Streptomyces cyaneus TaxID=1904 RepID=UPI000FF8792F|nr:hypothetical protein [Streptomyces cyaneus]
MLHEPENTLFVRGSTPVLLLAGASVHDALPGLTASDGQVPLCAGWGVVPKLTLCVVDGPGEYGLMVPSLAAPVLDAGGAGDMGAWCEDAERAGGAVVLSVDRIPEVLDWDHLLGSGTSRGGFVRIMN